MGEATLFLNDEAYKNIYFCWHKQAVEGEVVLLLEYVLI